MKKYSVILIALYVISTISGINCQSKSSAPVKIIKPGPRSTVGPLTKNANAMDTTTKKICIEQYNPCAENEDCCSSNCEYLNSTYKACFDRLPIDPAGRPLQYFYQVCSYEKPEDIPMSDRMFEIYGLNAAHDRLPTGSEFIVKANGRTIHLIINSLKPSGNTTLELSKEAAEALNVTGIVSCNIENGNNDNTDLLLFAPIVFIAITLFAIISHL